MSTVTVFWGAPSRWVHPAIWLVHNLTPYMYMYALNFNHRIVFFNSSRRILFTFTKLFTNDAKRMPLLYEYTKYRYVVFSYHHLHGSLHNYKHKYVSIQEMDTAMVHVEYNDLVNQCEMVCKIHLPAFTVSLRLRTFGSCIYIHKVNEMKYFKSTQAKSVPCMKLSFYMFN